MAPPPACSRCGVTRRVARTTFMKYMSMPVAHCASVSASRSPLGPCPAELTSASMRPQRCSAPSTSWLSASSLKLLPVTPKPPSSTPSASPLPDDDSTPTRNPSRASRRAAAAPIPLPPAVIRATFCVLMRSSVW